MRSSAGLAGPGLKSLREIPEFGKSEGRTADPSASLRSGRDDKGEGVSSIYVG